MLSSPYEGHKARSWFYGPEVLGCLGSGPRSCLEHLGLILKVRFRVVRFMDIYGLGKGRRKRVKCIGARTAPVGNLPFACLEVPIGLRRGSRATGANSSAQVCHASHCHLHEATSNILSALLAPVTLTEDQFQGRPHLALRELAPFYIRHLTWPLSSCRIAVKLTPLSLQNGSFPDAVARGRV